MKHAERSRDATPEDGSFADVQRQVEMTPVQLQPLTKRDSIASQPDPSVEEIKT